MTEYIPSAPSWDEIKNNNPSPPPYISNHSFSCINTQPIIHPSNTCNSCISGNTSLYDLNRSTYIYNQLYPHQINTICTPDYLTSCNPQCTNINSYNPQCTNINSYNQNNDNFKPYNPNIQLSQNNSKEVNNEISELINKSTTMPNSTIKKSTNWSYCHIL